MSEDCQCNRINCHKLGIGATCACGRLTRTHLNGFVSNPVAGVLGGIARAKGLKPPNKNGLMSKPTKIEMERIEARQCPKCGCVANSFNSLLCQTCYHKVMVELGVLESTNKKRLPLPLVKKKR